MSAAITVRGTSTPPSRELLRRERHRPVPVGGPRELLEVERIAAALLVETRDLITRDDFAQQLVSLPAREGDQLEPGEAPGAIRPLQPRREPVTELPGPRCERHQDRRGRRPMQQRRQQLHRRLIAPVQVVEHQHDRLAAREQLQQRPHRAMAAVALVLRGHVAALGQHRQRREHRRQLRADTVLEIVQQPRLQALQVLVERVDEHPERQILLELRG